MKFQEDTGNLAMDDSPASALLDNLKFLTDQAKPDIIISSTWRLEEINMDRIRRAFEPLGLSVKGATPDLSVSASGDRVDEVFAWLDDPSNKEPKVVNAWIAIDDLDLLAMNSKLEHSNFVRTDDKVGFTKANAEEAVAKLSAQLSRQ